MIKIPIYHQDILVSVNQSDNDLAMGMIDIGIVEVNSESLALFLEPLLNKTNYTAARTAYYENNGAIAIRIYDLNLTTPLGIATIIHEISHATSFIFDRIGMEHNRHTDEAYSYLIAYITQKFYENI